MFICLYVCVIKNTMRSPFRLSRFRPSHLHDNDSRRARFTRYTLSLLSSLFFFRFWLGVAVSRVRVTPRRFTMSLIFRHPQGNRLQDRPENFKEPKFLTFSSSFNLGDLFESGLCLTRMRNLRQMKFLIRQS